MVIAQVTATKKGTYWVQYIRCLPIPNGPGFNSVDGRPGQREQNAPKTNGCSGFYPVRELKKIVQHLNRQELMCFIRYSKKPGCKVTFLIGDTQTGSFKSHFAFCNDFNLHSKDLVECLDSFAGDDLGMGTDITDAQIQDFNGDRLR